MLGFLGAPKDVSIFDYNLALNPNLTGYLGVT